MLFIMFFIFSSTAQLFAMNNIHPQNQAAISVLPTEHKQEIMRWLLFSDQQSFASTCKLFNAIIKPHARVLQITALQPRPRIYRHYDANYKSKLEYIRHEIYAGLFWQSEVSYKSETATWKKNAQEKHFLLIVAFLTLIPIEFRGIAFPTIDFGIDLCGSIRLHKELADHTTIHQRIAERIKAQKFTVDGIHVNYYGNEQAAPLIEAARTVKVPTVIIDVYRGCAYEALTPFSILKQNEHLKRLELTIKNENAFCPYDIDANSMYAALEHNNSLEELCLSNIVWLSSCTVSDMLPKLLTLVLAKKNIKKLSLFNCECSHDNGATVLAALPHNNTLENVSLNQCRWLTKNDYIPEFLEFMKHNTQLKSFRLEKTSFNDAGRQQLNMSGYKPHDFIVT